MWVRGLVDAIWRKAEGTPTCVQAISWFAVGMLLASLLFGCVTGGSLEPAARQGEAMAIVWRQAYGRGESPPTVLWMRGSELTCIDPVSGNPGFETPAGCRGGYTAWPTTIRVADHGQRISESAFAHELVHAYQAWTLTFDPWHHTAPFQPGNLVDQANAALWEAGL